MPNTSALHKFNTLFLIFLLSSTSAFASNSVVTPDTRKTVSETISDSPNKIDPKLNITDVFTPKPSTDPKNPEIYFSADEVENNQ